MGFRHNFLIGLGGTGGAALKAFRAETVERAGEYQNLLQQGRRFEYLYLDSNEVDVDNASRWEYKDLHTGLELGTQALLLSLPENATSEEIANHPQVETWIGENGVEHLKETLLSGPVYGALQRRRYGRVLAAVNADAIRQRIKDGVCELSKGLAGCDRWVTFHVFASAGGGTGSGCLVDVLTLLPQLCHNFNIHFKIVAYLFVGGAEAEISNTGYFYKNEYATLRDVNALMANQYRPFRTLTDNFANPFHDKADPIDAVYISTGENGSCLSEQVKDFAACCFDMISCVPSACTAAARAFSGEDLYPTNPGEESVVEFDALINEDVVNQHLPRAVGGVDQFERSYRFQTLSRACIKFPQEAFADMEKYLSDAGVDSLVDSFFSALSVSSAPISPDAHGGPTQLDTDIPSGPWRAAMVCLPGCIAAAETEGGACASLAEAVVKRCQGRADPCRGEVCSVPELKEVRALFTEYYVPLRFFHVAGFLESRWPKPSLPGEKSAATYYANIDDAGMLDPSPDRPDLLPEEDPVKHAVREALRKVNRQKK
ncbi:MAG: hypothetical protein E7032_08645 [Akkermansiaceae bacterium]|nr:hypothetical protein [Akkermansiaceae bacterium]